MAKPKLSTAERQSALFGNPKPAPVMTVPPPNILPTSAAASVEADAPDFEAFLANPAADAPAAYREHVGDGTHYFGFRSRHSPHVAWTVAPGRWQRIDEAVSFAKQAKELDDRLEVQIFPVV